MPGSARSAPGSGRGRRRALHRPDAAAGVVAEQVPAAQPGQRAATIHVPTHDGLPEAVAVLGDRPHQRLARQGCGHVGFEHVRALERAPSQVRTRCPCGRQVVDLLPRVLADISYPQCTGGAVEGEAPRVAQTLREHAHARCRSRRRDADDLAEQGAVVLGAVLRIAPAAAVAHAHVEATVRPEGELSTVVVGIRLRDGEDDGGRGRVGEVGRGGGDMVAHHAGVPGRVGVVDVEETVGRVARTEREAQQSALPSARDACGEIEERCVERDSVPDDDDRAALLHDEEPSGVAGRSRDVEGSHVAAGQALQPHRRHSCARPRRHGHGRLRRGVHTGAGLTAAEDATAVQDGGRGDEHHGAEDEIGSSASHEDSIPRRPSGKQPRCRPRHGAAGAGAARARPASAVDREKGGGAGVLRLTHEPAQQREKGFVHAQVALVHARHRHDAAHAVVSSMPSSARRSDTRANASTTVKPCAPPSSSTLARSTPGRMAPSQAA